MAKRKSKQWKENVGAGVRKFDADVIQKLCESFAIDLNLKEACHYAEISPQCYDWNVKRNPKLLDKFEIFKSKLSIKSKHNIAQKIHTGDVPLSERYLARKNPDEYADTVKVQHSGDVANSTPQEDKEIIAEFHARLKANLQKRSRERAIKDGEI